MNAGIFASKTPGVVFAEIEMMRAISQTTGFIVEGHDDVRFWKEHISSECVTIVDCEGKKNLIEVAHHALQAGKRYVAGVYDSDFDRLIGVRYVEDLLAVTDENDLEIVLLRSPCFRRVLTHFADEGKIAAFEETRQVSVSDYIESVARKFGELRYINHQFQLGVNFDCLSPYRFVRSDDWVLDLAALHDQFIEVSGMPKADLDMQLLGTAQYERWQLVQGHDCMKVFAQGMKHVLARRQINEADLTRMLTLAFERAHLAETAMHAELLEIERRLGVKLLKR